ncbi:MAG: 5-methyltetrahydropteroyltriglutamate--homocysteine S-methyltransferase [Microcystis sp. M015S1]|jgi:5-methyltetrahydropteroyltriglutamate--homocysteine methyltransferase|uniref:5-methyltetrahydropteroyltriglutamate-- homocysteine S-methyltransferase n=2 Tax=unclassified Microcystis TaxID=2643300 RepID=UPI002590D310|nr:5-methyltetrahydropteroyltriglutamate--homocysteine S-methyltransferase [Microcystis sp. M017S1]MCA2919180.1 5-methyltetrahydropteroyltriglutamate--homocysteine S-methyltransferase [Microcystis sp. M017S1]MCA2936199.1 5-methyltetrahydropteroyltriglutamate--homocysteine S-methyltransferase [Microcystis sp. M015S1]MCA3160676.1 5-methyltetrahydropteroyltriglutamate--homocysteine S-methyltransferase [Burkholderiales bacterium]MCA3173509.1 5-methyltetrahydropteroyltriglutamate--homocysteine S-met
MAIAHIPGFSRVGAQRELKFALEAFWRGDTECHQLQGTGNMLKRRHWNLQRDAGLDYVTVGDFAWYDHVLQTLALVGALPTRFGINTQSMKLEDLFICARGNEHHFAMEMTKWFDTNYHYLVPEYTPDIQFELNAEWLTQDIQAAKQAGHNCKVVLLGPVSLLYLGKEKKGLTNRLGLLPNLLKIYETLLNEISKLGIQWVQIDEPILSLELDLSWQQALIGAYSLLGNTPVSLLLTTYFESVLDYKSLIEKLPIAGLHIDTVRAPDQLLSWHEWAVQHKKVLSVGAIDGRNIWRLDLGQLYETLEFLHQSLGHRLWISSSCSLLHVPVDLELELGLNPEIKSWLAFGKQKLYEISLLRDCLSHGKTSYTAALEENTQIQLTRKNSRIVHLARIKAAVNSIQPNMSERSSAFECRIEQQRSALNLPLFPTTTIGSFPQTIEIRRLRSEYKRGAVKHLDYLQAMRQHIEYAVKEQEALGLDVLVHGEAERNDMVEYFGELLTGFAFTQYGWVQSYSSRCVKPPIIYGDVTRLEPMTISWTSYAQSLTNKPMKGMLTGPVTMLQWSFVRNDQSREQTALQIALALRDEVLDLERAGIRIIQIDEPAFREGLPLKQRDWSDYLRWAVNAFKLTAAAVQDGTQIHTHMCYSEFNDILNSIAALDADVITIETSRSDMDLLDAFVKFQYPNDIGPGVYDIHSPRTPQVPEMIRLLKKASTVIPAERLWINPDCGLKTRQWSEVVPALKNMVQAAQTIRQVQQEQITPAS